MSAGAWRVRYRRSDADAAAPWTSAPLAPSDAEGLEVEGLERGVAYDLRVAFVDENGVVSQEQVLTEQLVEVEPRDVPAPQGLIAIDEDCLTWSHPLQRDRLAGFEIRTAAGDHRHWASAEPAHEGLVAGPPFLLCGQPGGTRTYLVRAVDVDGTPSEPAVTVVELRDQAPALPVVVWTRDYAALGYPGTRVGASVSGTALLADTDSKNRFWPPAGDEVELFWPPDHEPFWKGDAEPFWPVVRQGVRFWAPDGGALFWATPYMPVTYLAADLDVPMHAINAGAARLTIEVASDETGWRLEYREHTAPFWPEDPKAQFWPEDDALFWPIDAAPWKVWPGAITALRAGRIQLRWTAPGGARRAALRTFRATLSAVA